MPGGRAAAAAAAAALPTVTVVVILLKIPQACLHRDLQLYRRARRAGGVTGWNSLSRPPPPPPRRRRQGQPLRVEDEHGPRRDGPGGGQPDLVKSGPAGRKVTVSSPTGTASEQYSGR